MNGLKLLILLRAELGTEHVKGMHMIDIALIHYLPLLPLGAGMLLLLPAPLLAVHRMPAATAALAIIISAALYLLGVKGDASLTSLFLLPCMALLIAAPMLERARFLGLAVAALSGSIALNYGVTGILAPNLPALPALSLLPVSLVAALIVGMIGGLKLPLHPQRIRADGSAVWHNAPQAAMLAGWLCIGLAFALFCGVESLTLSHAIAALAAGLVVLVQAQMGHGQDALQKAGEGLVAGFLMVLLVPLSPLAAMLLGLVAGFFVIRSESIALALRLDDPHHFLGALLLPSLLGLVLPGLFALKLLAPQLQWLGASLALAAGISLILWPLTMFMLGVALPPRLVREGVQNH